MLEIKKTLDDALNNHQIPCSDIVVSVGGKIVYRYMNGTSDEQKKVSIKGDELYYLYSATKPITCTAALQLYEKGLLDLEDHVEKYIPEFANLLVKTKEGTVPAQNPMKIKHLFTMTSGLNYDLNSVGICEQIKKNPFSTTSELVKAMAKTPLEFEPGTHYLYSLSHDVLAVIIEVVSGMSYGEYLQEHIFNVCGMKNTYVGCPEEVKSRIVSQYIYDEENDKTELMEKENVYILTPNYQSGGAGIVSCVDDYILFENTLINSEKLLKRTTVDLMRQGHLSDVEYNDLQNFKKDYSYGLGVRVNIADNFSVKGEFGWDGAAGAYGLMDPENRIAVFYTTHVRNRAYLYNELHPQLRDIVYRTLGIRSNP